MRQEGCIHAALTTKPEREMTSKRTFLKLSLGALAGHWVPARAHDFSSKPITLVVPFAAGGATDVTARRLAEEMSKALGASVIVENKPGAGSFIAATHVTRAARDGHTLLFAGSATTSMNPHIFRNLPYKVSDLAPVSTVSKQAFVLNGSLSTPATNVQELIAYARSKPEGLTIGTVGTGTGSHILAEWIARALDIKAVFVPYKGTSQSTIDLISGRIDTQIDGISTATTMHKAGKTRLLASMGTERSILPEGVQTFTEAGYPELVAYANFALLAPRGTPKDVIETLHAAVVAATKTPSFAEPLLANGEIPDPSESPEQYAEVLRREYERWGEIIRPMNLQLD
jgi:tripartite-type tricarboxylate transporter receptor subunit TctC